MLNMDNQDISEIEDIISDGDNQDEYLDVRKVCYLKALAKTQLLILKELRKPKGCTCHE